MLKKHIPNLSIYLPELETLRRIAAQYGCILAGTRRKGDGSVRQLLERIARGDIALVSVTDIADPDAVCKELEAVAATASPAVALILRRCAGALRLTGLIRRKAL